MPTTFNHIVAIDQTNGIGKDGDLIWHLPSDLAYFKKITSETTDPNKQNVVIMGRVTWESIPEKYRPMSNRLNIVLSRRGLALPEEVAHATTFEEALTIATHWQNDGLAETIFVMGGASLYKETIADPRCQKLYITQLQQTFDCDAYYPAIPSEFVQHSSSPIHTEKEISFTFDVLTRS